MLPSKCITTTHFSDLLLGRGPYKLRTLLQKPWAQRGYRPELESAGVAVLGRASIEWLTSRLRIAYDPAARPDVMYCWVPSS